MGIFKKGLAVFLAALMLVSVFSVMAFAADETYYVAGVPELCGNGWAPADSANQMTDNGAGVFTMTYTDVPAMQNYQFKVTDGTWDNAWGAGKDNFVFHVTETCDVTITFDATTKEVSVSGDNVVVPEGFSVEKVIAVGDNKADANFLNGISWQENNDANAMSTADGKVYTITYYGVAKKDDYGFKFAVNGTWASNFGALKENPDGESLQWDGDNIKFDVEYDYADVTLTLDLTNFNYDEGKTGATYKVDIVEASAPTEPVTEEATPDETQPETQATPDETEPATQASPDETQPETQPEKEIVPGFYLVGSEEVCGAEWGWDAPWLYGEPMKQATDGTYFQVATNVPASAGNITDEGNDVYVFKVVYVDANGGITWHPGGMGNNTIVTVNEDDSTILFQFKLLASRPTKEGSDPEAVIATVYGPEDELPDFTDPQYPTKEEDTTAACSEATPEETEPATQEVTEPATQEATEPATAEPATAEPTVAPTAAPTVAPTEAVAPTVAPTTAPSKSVVVKANTVKVKVKKAVKVKAKKLKKKKVSIKISKFLKITGAKGTVTFAKVKKGTDKKIFKKIKINKKNGKITLKKGKYAKKTYKIKVKIKVAGKTVKNVKYKAKTITKVIKIKVK